MSASGHEAGRAVVQGQRVIGGTTWLDGVANDGTHVQVDVGAVADLRAARRWSFSMRRIDGIVVERDHRRTRCSVSGVGHRMPVTRQVSPEMALGLGQLGVPMRLAVRGDVTASVESGDTLDDATG